MREWTVSIKGTDTQVKQESITLLKLRDTIRNLKTKGPSFSKNKWASPIVPLLIEHIFMANLTPLGSILNFSLDIREGKDIKTC